VLAALGYTRREIDQEELAICGHMTIEGAPHLRDEHLAIFDCATRCGRQGQRCIHHMGHIRMMAAVQPFISGAISKTINMPNETTVDEIREAYFDAWRLGLKAVALYRDGCKQSQPLQSSGKRTEAVTGDSEPGGQRAGNGEGAATTAVAEPEVTGCSNGRPHGEAAAAGGQGTAAERTAAAQEARLIRQRLPKKRRGFTQEARVGGNKVYVRTGEYPDGRLGEIFVDMHKEGAAFRSLMNCLAIAVSLGLQHGVPLEEYVDAFVFTRFDPQGPVDHPNIKFATSVIDYIFRVLGMEYLGRRDFVHIEPADQDDEEERAVERSAHSRAGASGVEPTGDAARGDTRLAAAGAAETAVAVDEETATRGGDRAMPESPLSQQARLHMADAPFCDTCGHLTVRNGSCYKCLNCGNSMGCS
jgi:ribonucleoside-diphosphate reductase alpha chain